MKITRWTAVIVSTLTLALGACARNATLQGETRNRDVSPRIGSVAVTVANNNFADMRVYAVLDGGVRMRIGTVTGLSSATLVVRWSMFPTGTLRLVASPIGGRGAAHSGPLPVTGGQWVNFTIQPSLSTSYGMVRVSR